MINMKTNTTEMEYLLSILRCAVTGAKLPKPPQNIEWKVFLEFARKQGVFPIISQVIAYDDIPSDVAGELNNYSKSELVRLIAMQNELKAVKSALVTKGIRFMLLKGSVIKEYYPKPSMRQMTDIDILYDEENQKGVFEIMKSFGYKCISLGGNSDDFHKNPYYTFEFHRELFKDTYGFFPDFSFVWQNAKKSADNPYEYFMSSEDLYLHHIAHMYKHYKLGGFGIRFLIDTYLILNSNANKWNDEYIRDKLKELNLTEFENQISNISFAIINNKSLSLEQQQFLNESIGFGLFGNKNAGVELMYEEFLETHKNSSYLSYVFSRIFPNKKFMQEAYKVLNYKPYLLPLYYVIRLLSKSGMNIKKAKKELKTVKEISNSKKDSNIN